MNCSRRAGDDVHVARPHDGAIARARRRDHRRQPVELHLVVLDPGRVEPLDDERHRSADALGPRGVEGDQALGQRELVGSGHMPILADGLPFSPR